MTTYADENAGKDDAYSLLLGVNMGAATMEISMELPPNPENTSTTRASSITLRIYPKGSMSYYRGTCFCLVQVNTYFPRGHTFVKH